MLALTRDVSPAIARCELTHVVRERIDVDLARRQHEQYEHALESLGCVVRRLPADDTMPDSVFIEDTAIVLRDVAVIARPGAPSRRREVVAVSLALSPMRSLVFIVEPGTLDGGDVVVLGRTIYVGRSSRTNADGIGQLRVAVYPYGYTVTTVDVAGCLHLKSAVTALNDRTVLLNRAWVSTDVFAAFDRIEVDPGEPAAANVVSLDGQLIVGSTFPRTRMRLERAGFPITTVDASELAKAEGALTCCSLLVA